MVRPSKNFVDSIQLLVRGGVGGHGMQKYGGIGGNGGNVYLEAVKVKELNSCSREFPDRCVNAGNGEDSKKFKIYGEAGPDKVVYVPAGLTVYDEKNKKLGELNKVKERLIVARGGLGGSPTSKPPFSGSKGEERLITLDLKLIADVGLVGFPNAGKSTLLKAISRASPKIAAYAFTTLQPNLGVVEYDDLRRVTVADLPGLIEGAHENRGMGHAFLKHVERTSVLLMVADVDGFQLKPSEPHRTCLETVVLLNKELELYNKALAFKPIVLAVNKMDLPGSENKLKEIMPYLKNMKRYVKENIPEDMRPQKIVKFKNIIPISARYDKDSVEKLKIMLRDSVEEEYHRAHRQMFQRKEGELIDEIERMNSEHSQAYL